MSLGTPQGRGIAAAAAAGSVARSAYQAYKRKRLMSSIKKTTRRAAARGKNNKAVAIGKRVGPFLGSIAATKPVKLVKGSTLYRMVKYRQYAAAPSTRCMWYGGSSVGPRSKTFEVMADAFICHYLKRLKDHRSSRTFVPTGPQIGAGPQYGQIWHYMTITFGRPGAEPDFNSYTPFQLTNGSIEDMVYALRVELQNVWIDRNMVPVSLIVTARNTISGAGTTHAHVFRDDFVYKNTYAFECKSNFKVNNTTLSNSDNSNVNAVDANPIDGRIYTFRNRVPVFSPSYLVGLTNPQREEITDISAIDQDFDTGVNYDPLLTTSIPHELNAPPLRPAVLFKNAKTSTPVMFAPGGYKMFSMRFSKEATMYTLFKSLCPVDSIGTDGLEITPPGGDSFLMCLKPTIRVGSNNDMALHTQAEFVYRCNVKAGKPAKLPTVQEIN